jgi:hypothetical protein
LLENFYCLDNDIILKLATCDLFQDTINTFDITPTQIKILDSFQYKFGKQIKRKRGNKAQETSKYNIEKSLKITQDLTTLNQNKFDTAIYNIYTELLNSNQITNDKNNTIDQGEAILISYVSYFNQQGSNNYLLTGDKRCLRALINANFPDIIQSLNGKIYCLEQLILKNIESYGFDYVKNKVVPCNNCDTALKVAFSNDKVTQENSILALKNYLNELRDETGDLLNSYGE